MPPYRHSDNMYLYNIIRMMEQHMHKQLFLHQCEIYITVLHNSDIAELQMSWQDYLTNTILFCIMQLLLEIHLLLKLYYKYAFV